MEAASARAAARDRWSEFGHAPSQLQRFIQAACSPDNYEPNLAVNLEVADLINSKKGSAPREAAIAIVNFVNHRNPNVALLALNLLDICVKNCGYPFHLQISTKEFLNELVRRFPERPPIRPTRIQARILEEIEEWRLTICETSRYKEDLGFIRDMHRLLSYKGYMFPEVRREDAAVLNPSDNLKSAEEMEEEEREAHSAKLQELIRRGSPEDLREANRLMKVMAGYDNRSKTDYRAKAAEDISKIQAKARLLEERLEAYKPGEDSMKEGDVFSELAASLQSAQPKIQKMCEEESDDHEAVAKLFEINDSIHRTVERYHLMKKGDMDGAAKVAAGGPTPSRTARMGASAGTASNELSLIDFDQEAEDATARNVAGPPGDSPPSGLENDLLGLDLGGASSTYGKGGNIALGFGANQNISGPALLSSMTHDSSARGPATNQSPPPSQFPSFASPAPPQQQQQRQSAAAVDVFAGLGISAASSKPGAAPSFPATAPSSSNDNDDGEWSFASSLPPDQSGKPKPTEHTATVSNTAVRIDLRAGRASPSSPSVNLVFAFSNNTAEPVHEIHFQLAVTKGYELQLKPQTGRDLAPKQSRGVTQEVSISHAGNPVLRVGAVKLRWRVAYKLGAAGQQKNEMGEITEFTIA